MLQLYNSLTRRKQPFAPADGHTAKVYSCGPTVYDVAHIGNLRTFVFNDILCRYLRFKGFEVKQVMNITDVDDKTIAGAQAEGISLAAYTEKHTECFFEDIETLNIQRAGECPRATEHIAQMQELIQQLLDNGHAYIAEGSVYYDISSFADYGKLSGVQPKQLADSSQFSRLEGDEYEREQVNDFVLWKAAKPGEPAWDSPWGPGRPGWHIECSAMSMAYLEPPLDIHTGAVDLLFPHHENEIAQSEGATGELFCRFWLHPEHLIVEGQKMSKSLGNFYALRDLLAQGYSPQAIRHQLLTAHYRQQLNFTTEGLQQSERTVERLSTFLDRLPRLPLPEGSTPQVVTGAAKARQDFAKAMDDDLNVPGAMAAVFELIKQANGLIDAGQLRTEDREAIFRFVAEADSVLGIMTQQLGASRGETTLDEEVAALIAERETARKQDNYARADDIREQLAAQGIILEDTPTGTLWRRGPVSRH